MKKVIYLLSVVCMMAAAFTIQGCSDSDSSGGASRLSVTAMDTVAVSQLDFGATKGTKMIGINTDGNWDAVVSDTSWIKLSARAGYGYQYETRMSWLNVSVVANTSEARTGTLTITSGGLSKVVTINQMGRNLNDNFISATEFLEEAPLGYNLGNTLESNHDITSASVQSWFNPQTPIDWETCWGQPQTTQEIIDAIASKGFKVIRVPVTWFPHMDANDNIDAAWMARVKEVVNMVIKSGCYCIINVHHDASEYDASRGDGAHWLLADLSNYDTISKRFKKLWQQIAEAFQDYDDKLLFEAVNEILDEKGNWGNPDNADAYTAINKLEQDFVDVVRATGGNNTYRNLVVNPYSAGHTQAKLNGFNAPSDVVAGHILASVHSYDPYNFCNDNGQWNVEAFDSSCETEIDEMFSMVDKRFRQELGIPYFYGEFGALDDKKLMAERVKYATYMAKKFKAYGTIGLWWMGLIERKSLEWYEVQIVDALMEGIK
ncbi:MAG: cellulase family glycosylhydrolase [Prevotella sp.]|nr:cellulase family glycosylhydrolase [Prevotella sp.]